MGMLLFSKQNMDRILAYTQNEGEREKKGQREERKKEGGRKGER